MTEVEQDALMDRLVSAPPGSLGAAGGTTSEPDSTDGPSAAGPRVDPLASADLTRRERAILTYADKLTVDPSAVTEADVRVLRDAGLDDRAIHDTCAITAYFGFVNRMADGLGVELEDDDRAWKDGK